MKETITSIKNFRDLAGMKGKDPVSKEEKTIKPHLLLRGARLTEMTDEDGERLKNEYNVGCVIDLRTTQETVEKPDKVIPGIEYIHIPIIDEAMAGITKEHGTDTGAAVQKSDSEEALLKVIPDLVPLYSLMVKEPYCIAQMTKAIRKIMETTEKGQAVFFHCTGGKDRTGVLAALLETILGVGKKDIYADYLKTNRGNYGEIMKIYYYGAVVKHSRKAAKKMAICLLAYPTFLKSTFDAMIDRAASVSSFITYVMGITKEEQEAFAKAVLA